MRLDSISQDLRSAVRSLRSTRGVHLAALAMLTIGIGATRTILDS
jgi:hypothetical protein